MEADDEKEQDPESKGDALLIIAKNRNGPTDDVPLKFIDHSMRFVAREGETEGA
jgi:replicative DNA helicase